MLSKVSGGDVFAARIFFALISHLPSSPQLAQEASAIPKLAADEARAAATGLSLLEASWSREIFGAVDSPSNTKAVLRNVTAQIDGVHAGHAGKHRSRGWCYPALIKGQA